MLNPQFAPDRASPFLIIYIGLCRLAARALHAAPLRNPTDARDRRPYRTTTIRLLRFPKAVSCRGVACYAHNFAASPRIINRTVCTDATRCVRFFRAPTRTGSLGIPNLSFKRKAKRMAFRYNGSHLKTAVSGNSFR